MCIVLFQCLAIGLKTVMMNRHFKAQTVRKLYNYIEEPRQGSSLNTGSSNIHHHYNYVIYSINIYCWLIKAEM